MNMKLLLMLGTLALGWAADSSAAPPVGRPATNRPASAFPAHPQITDRFADPGSGWPAAGYQGGNYVLGDGKQTAVAPAPDPVTPGRRGTLAEVQVWPPHGGGSAGLFCRGSAEARYALLVDDGGRVAVVRLAGRQSRVLKLVTLPPGERSHPGKPTLLRFACGEGEGDRPVTLAFAVNASPFAYVYDRPALAPGGASRVGLVADGRARFDDFALWLAN